MDVHPVDTFGAKSPLQVGLVELLHVLVLSPPDGGSHQSPVKLSKGGEGSVKFSKGLQYFGLYCAPVALGGLCCTLPIGNSRAATHQWK
ncbi:MAG TPA: hypothetical protein VLX12_05160 [Syntrophorhabdales bacterium]|nr:hypothetical protein [Syntrophorhabdales bacterium]